MKDSRDWVILELGTERRVTHSALEVRAAQLAGCLHAAGLEEGDRVAYFLENGIPVFEIIAACQRLGLRPVPINYHSTEDEARYVLENSGARALFTSELFAERLARASRDLPSLSAHRFLVSGSHPAFRDYGAALTGACPWAGPQPPAPGLVIYTSGTTGHPKGVVRQPFSPSEAAAYLRVFRDVCRLGDHPVHLVTGPLYHSAPSAFARVALQLGGSVILMARFDPEELLASIERYEVTNLHLVPTMMRRLLALPAAVRQRYELRSLVSVQHAAAPCPPAVKRALIEWWGPIIEEYYGSTEAGLCTYIASEEALARPGSVGRAIAGVDLAILDEEGRRRGPREEGDIGVDNPITRGFTYLGDTDKRAKASREGFFLTGDVGYLDEEGYLFLCDRRSDMIISGGVNIYPAEIEQALSGHAEVSDCAVFGVPDAEWGESVHATVQLHPGATVTARDLMTYLEQRVARFKVPRVIEFVTELPREPSGKIFKRKLREPYWRGRSTAII